MVVNCPQCETRLQLDEAKTPSHPFKVRCPKCQTSVDVQPPSNGPTEPEAVPPAQPTSPYQRPASAVLFNPRSDKHQAPATSASGPGAEDLAALLTEALQNAAGVAQTTRNAKRALWDRRKALVCSSPAYRETIAQLLANSDYDVYVADNMPQALGRMREEWMDVIVLDANFDPLEQGVAFVTREVKLMRPSQRRRLFLVFLSNSVRTMDLHAAFLHNVNLVINPSDIEQLPDALDISIRQYNELYRDFNRALAVSPI